MEIEEVRAYYTYTHFLHGEAKAMTIAIYIRLVRCQADSLHSNTSVQDLNMTAF